MADPARRLTEADLELVEAIRKARLNVHDFAFMESCLGQFPHMMTVIRALREWTARGDSDG